MARPSSTVIRLLPESFNESSCGDMEPLRKRAVTRSANSRRDQGLRSTASAIRLAVSTGKRIVDESKRSVKPSGRRRSDRLLSGEEEQAITRGGASPAKVQTPTGSGSGWWAEEGHKRLALLLEEHGAQAALARKLGRTEGAISNWARGTRKPSLDDVAAICDVLGVSADWLLGLVEVDLVAVKRQLAEGLAKLNAAPGPPTR